MPGSELVRLPGELLCCTCEMYKRIIVVSRRFEFSHSITLIQWAFANYIQTAGGCNYVQDIVCESINQQALIAYKSQMNTASKYQDALECIVDRCGISIDEIPTGKGGRLSHMSIQGFNSRRAAAWALVVVVSVAAAGAAYYTSRRQMTQVGEGAYLAANKQVTKGTVG